MKRTTAFLIAILFCAVIPAYALYTVNEKGEWPKSWPKQLEPLRKHSRTFVGPEVENRHYAIPFAKRETFEAAWPHLLKVKSKGAPVFLVRGPSFFLGDNVKAGVIVHSPPLGHASNRATPEGPIESTNLRVRWMYTTYIEVVVDGDVIDASRLRLPKNTVVIDELNKGKTYN